MLDVRETLRDAHGRQVLLRGVNLGGTSKSPAGVGSYQKQKEGECTFVGRPVPLDEADTHLARLRQWGFTALRYVFTWEALEHDGPGVYDREYIAYTVEVLRRARAHGFYVVMDPHQDLAHQFSRFAGGSGAPVWALYAAGLDPEALHETHAALLHDAWDPPKDYPPMIWATNYHRLACLTLFTLFFAGDTFAKRCTIDDEPIQGWLQRHFLGAVAQLVTAVREADLLDECVIGWDSLNEPHPGLVGADLRARPGPMRQGPMPTPFESMLLGEGEAVTLPTYTFGALGARHTGSVHVAPKRGVWLTADADAARGAGRYGWRRGAARPGCVWAQHGVWDTESKTLLQPDYFRADFVEGFWLPHWAVYTRLVRSIHARAILFVQPPVFAPPPHAIRALLDERACSSAHFYDGLTLVTKRWHSFNADGVGILRGAYSHVLFALALGRRAVRACLARQLARLAADVAERMGPYPFLVGETGVPMDMGDATYAEQAHAMDATLAACDANLLGYFLWTYTADHSSEWGDRWNGEDLSLWSPHGPDARWAYARGARAIDAWCRPYARAVPGRLTHLAFDMTSKVFAVSFSTGALPAVVEARTAEIYLPYIHYGRADARGALSIDVTASDGDWTCTDQLLLWRIDADRSEHTLRVRRVE